MGRLEHSQNFLKSRRVADRIIELSDLGPGDVVIEIGPGTGKLTRSLLDRGTVVIAIERDAQFARRLAQEADSRLVVIHADILDVPLPQTPFNVVANIPFQITTAIISKLTSGLAPPAKATIVMQKQAAERFAGRPMVTLWSLNLFPEFDVTIPMELRRNDFEPRPNVDSVVATFVHRRESRVGRNDIQRWRGYVAFMFTAWQPTFELALRKLAGSARVPTMLRTAGFDSRQKVSEVPPEGWLSIFQRIQALEDARIWRRCEQALRDLERQQSRLDRPTRTRRR